MTIGAFLATYFTAGIIYDYEDTVQQGELPAVDAIVVLAGAKGRIQEAGELWHRYLRKGGTSAPVLYIAGMGPRADWSVLEQQISSEVLSTLNRDRVVMETESADTKENALWAARYAQEKGWRRILLVTSSYHMKRAAYIFERVMNGPLRGRSPKRAAARAKRKSRGAFTPLQADGNPAGPRLVRIETLTLAHEPFVQDRWQKNAYGVRVTIIEFVKWVYYRMYW